MAQAEEIRFKEFRERFATEDACRAELFRLRFAEGFVCPKCGGREFYPIKGRNTYQCRSCRHQTSVTAGTVMHHTRLPLTIWFWAIWLVATDKRGDLRCPARKYPGDLLRFRMAPAGSHPCRYGKAGCTISAERNCGNGRWICGRPLPRRKKGPGNRKSTSGSSPLQNGAGHTAFSASEGRTQCSESDIARDHRSKL